MGCLDILATLYLVLLNSIFVLAAIVALCRGVYIYAQGQELSKNIIYHAIGLDDFYKEIALKFILPGVIMLFVSCFGCCGALQDKKNLLLSYSVCMVFLAAANIYCLIALDRNAFTLFDYLRHNVFTSDVNVYLENGKNIPELIIQFLALLSALYLCYSISNKIKKRNAQAQFIRLTT